MAADRIEINTASLEELDQIVGIGPALGQRIIDARPFLAVEDLLKVKGIGEKTLQKIKDQGLAYVGEISNAQLPISNKVTEPTPEPPPAIIYSTGIIINEILPAPEGADEENEYIEIYNSGATDADIFGWKLQDIRGTGATYFFAKNTIIKTSEYLVFKRPETKITLNNDEDGLNFLFPDGKIADSVSFTKAPKNQSYNKTASDWQWSTTLTPGAKNTITEVIKITKATKKATNILPSTLKTDNKYLSALSESPNFQPKAGPPWAENPWLLFLTVFIAAIILGTIILILKLKIIKKIF